MIASFLDVAVSEPIDGNEVEGIVITTIVILIIVAIVIVYRLKRKQ